MRDSGRAPPSMRSGKSCAGPGAKIIRRKRGKSASGSCLKFAAELPQTNCVHARLTGTAYPLPAANFSWRSAMPHSATLAAASASVEKRETRNEKLTHGLLPLLARILVTPVFLQAGIAKVFSGQGNVQYGPTRHITWPPLVALMLGGAAAIEIFAGLAVLLGFKRSEEHTSELQSHSFISYAVF